MTDNEIIKALMLCRKGNCGICTVHCTDVRDGAYELIKRQKAEIKRLESNLKFVRGTVERLRKYDEERDVRLHAKLTETARSEAIKEFAERLKEPFEFYADAEEADALYIVGLIDDLVKEMTEEPK